MVILHKSVNLDNAVLVTLDLLINVIGLNLGQDFDHCLLEAGSCHQLDVVRCCESFISDFDLLDRLHAIADLVVHIAHEVAAARVTGCPLVGRTRSCLLKDEHIALLLEVYLVEDFDAWSP